MATDTPVPTDALLPCPFCGAAPIIVERPNNIDGTEFICAFACYCGGYSACAHKMAVRKTPELAKADALAAWNRRAQPAPAEGQKPLTVEQRNAVFDSVKYGGENGWEADWSDVIDAVEAAHGIKER